MVIPNVVMKFQKEKFGEKMKFHEFWTCVLMPVALKLVMLNKDTTSEQMRHFTQLMQLDRLIIHCAIRANAFNVQVFYTHM